MIDTLPAFSAVLVVDDEPETRTLLRMNLGARGYPVVTASTGQEAITAFSKDGIGLVLLDLGLPDVSGLDVCRRLRSVSDLPIVVMTARLQHYDPSDALAAGADEFLPKPFGIQQLLGVLRRATGKRRGSATA